MEGSTDRVQVVDARTAFQAEVLRDSAGSCTEFPGYKRMVCRDWAMVTGSTLSEDTVTEAIQSEVRFFRDLGREFEWKVYSWDTPATLGSELKVHGFTEGDEEAIMIFDLTRDFSHFCQSEHRTVRVTTDEHLTDYRWVENHLGSERSFLNEVIDSLRRGSTDSMGFVAYSDDQPVSIARLNCHEGSVFGGCYGGSTLPEFQRKGYYRSLLLARALVAKSLGIQYLQVDSLPTSRPILEKVGFEQIGSTWPFTWSPA
jgi:GNAT superfamily N-acetyltransferase